MPASHDKQPPIDQVRPADFAQLLVAAWRPRPRLRARDQQADLAGETLRQRVLNRLIVLDPDSGELDSALLAIISEFGDPAGPTRGVCTAIQQEWEMTQIHPGYWAFLVGQAIQADEDDSGSRSKRAARPRSEF